MRLSRDETVEGYPAELQRFGALLETLGHDEWTAASRCEGWTVADVVAHVTGTLEAIAGGRIEELADPDHVVAQVTDRRSRSQDEVVEEYAKVSAQTVSLLDAFDEQAWSTPAPGGVAATIGDGVEALWYDTYVHAEDIRAALARPSETGPGVRISIAHLADVLTEQGWGPATLALDGQEEFAIGAGGRRITGDPREFILAATGRLDPAKIDLDETVNVYR